METEKSEQNGLKEDGEKPTENGEKDETKENEKKEKEPSENKADTTAVKEEPGKGDQFKI